MTEIDLGRLSILLRKNTDLRVIPDELHLLEGSGLQHDHVILGNTGWLARIPRGNTDLDSESYLRRQAEIYRTASPSGHTPELLGSISPADGLPHGALIVCHIENARMADFGRDYEAIARSLAAIHAIRTPSHIGEAASTGDSQRQFIEAMLVPCLDKPQLGVETRTLLRSAMVQCDRELAWMNRFPALPFGFIVSDAHPGNFLIDPKGKAWMVDLEYATIDTTLIDIAIASCPLTRQFVPRVGATVPPDTDGKFFAAYLKHTSHSAAERESLIAVQPSMRRVALLGSLGWLAFWKAEGNATMTDIPMATAGNWDRLASKYLEPARLKATLRAAGFEEAQIIPRRAPTHRAAPGLL